LSLRRSSSISSTVLPDMAAASSRSALALARRASTSSLADRRSAPDEDAAAHATCWCWGDRGGGVGREKADD